MVTSRERTRRRLNADLRRRGMGGARFFAYEQGPASGSRGPIRMTFGTDGSGELTSREGITVIDRHLDRAGTLVPMAFEVALSSTFTRALAKRVSAIAVVNAGETEGPMYFVKPPGEPTTLAEVAVRFESKGELGTPHVIAPTAGGHTSPWMFWLTAVGRRAA